MGLNEPQPLTVAPNVLAQYGADDTLAALYDEADDRCEAIRSLLFVSVTLLSKK